jgi:hypothetical protein
MADHLKPTITSTYSSFVTELDKRFDDLAVGLDPATNIANSWDAATNLPSGSIRWNSVSNKWQKYNGTTFNDLSSLYAINISGNSASATNLITNRTDWLTNGTITAVVGQLAWKNFGNNHTIFDASAGTAPDGTAVSSTAAATAWANTYPTLMGWNGTATYGVRVDSSRVSDKTASAVTFNNAGAGAVSGTTFDGSTARTISYNSIGAPSTTGTGATGSWAIAITGNASTATNGVVTTGLYNNPAWITGLAGSKISGSITGNSGTTTKLATAVNINSVAFDGSSAISVNLNNSVTFNNGGGGAVSGTAFSGSAATTVSYNSIGAPSTSGTNATGSWAIAITGNSATTTKLATAVTIGGVSFDGSANINLPGVNSAGNQNTSGNAGSSTKLTTTNWIVEEAAGVLQIKTSLGVLKFSMHATDGFTVH